MRRCSAPVRVSACFEADKLHGAHEEGDLGVLVVEVLDGLFLELRSVSGVHNNVYD